MSSRSPSTVRSAVRRMARGSTRSPRKSSLPLASLASWNTQATVLFGREVQHREILIVERFGGARLLNIALRRVLVEVEVRLAMAVDVHGHEGCKLHETRIDPPPGAAVAQGHARDQVMFEPFDRPPVGKIIDL